LINFIMEKTEQGLNIKNGGFRVGLRSIWGGVVFLWKRRKGKKGLGVRR